MSEVRIFHDVDLTSLNTLRLPSRARAYAEVSSAAELTSLAQQWRAENPEGRRFVLGGGSNLVLTQDFDGLIVRPLVRGIKHVGEDGDHVFLAVGAGENWHQLVLWTLREGLPGLENLVAIPGTVGAAPVQNIGAYGLELSDRVQEVRAIDLATGEYRIFDRSACRFGYRDSVFKQEGWHRTGQIAIVEVVLRLPRRWQAMISYTELAQELSRLAIESPTAGQIADAVAAIRQRKLPDPAVLPNAGSFFQNPVVDIVTATKLAAHYPDMPRFRAGDAADSTKVKLAAAWMIQRAGWKGRDLGPVGMYEHQALVLVNREPGTARGADVGMLAEAVRSDVRRLFGVALQPEPVIL